MLLTSIFAACHVIILIGEKDLGGALIYFVVYVFLCYVATGRGIYLFGGIGAGTLAAKLAVHAVCACAGSFYCLERSLVCH